MTSKTEVPVKPDPPATTVLAPPQQPYEPGLFVQSKYAVFLRAPYNYNPNHASDATALKCLDPSLTDQSQAEESDINTIVRNFGITGKLPENPHLPEYGDFTGINDYQQALNAIHEADQNFLALPAEIRKRFDNNPQHFLEFVSDERNREDMREMGLLKEPKQGDRAPDAPHQKEPLSPSTIENK